MFRINILPLSSESNSTPSCLLGLFFLEPKLQTIRSTEMWRNFYKTARRHIIDDSPFAVKLSGPVSRVKMERISASVPDEGGSESFANVWKSVPF
jgi:hypothetical protein